MNHLGTRALTTERLTLRRFEIEDAEDAFYNWCNDEEVTIHLTWNPHASVEETKQIIESWIAQYSESNFYQWAIELNESEQAIGSISVVNIDESVGSLEVGYCIGKAYWHQGYTTEALREVILFLINEVGAGRVWARHHVDNVYSGRVMQAAGMELEGILRKSIKDHTGIGDAAVYAKIRSAALDEEDEQEEIEEIPAVVTKVVDENGVEHNTISDETMEYVGILAKLELTPEEAKSAKKDMEEMLDYIDQLNELDTDGIEPMSHVFPVCNVFREDVPVEHDGSVDTLKNAPVTKDGGMKVPKTIGE